MSEHNYNYHDDSFSLDETKDYTLLIQIEEASFSYAVTIGYRLIAWAENHPLDELSNPQELLDMLSARYRQVVIGLPASGFTLVPQSLYAEDRVASFARFLDVKTSEKVLAQSLDAENTIIYKTSEAIVNATEDLGLSNTVPSSKGWITAIAQNRPGNHDLYLNIDNHKVEIVYFDGGKLRFYNSFEFFADDELAYFAVMVTNELNLEPKNTNLYLSGDINADDTTITRLAQFFGKAEVNSLKVVQLPQEIVSHKVLSISALLLCASSEVV